MAQAPGLLGSLFHFLPWPHLLLFLSLLSHSFDDSSSCQCLPCPVYWALTVGKLALSPPIRQPLQNGFPANLFFFPFQWLNQDQEAVMYTEAQLAKEKGECPGELSMSITSVYSQHFEGKASNGTPPAMFIQSETRTSVFHLANVPGGPSPYQKWLNVRLNATFWL